MLKMKIKEGLFFGLLLISLFLSAEAAKKCEVKNPTFYFEELQNGGKAYPYNAHVIEKANFLTSHPLFDDKTGRIISSMSFDPIKQRLLFVNQNHPDRIYWYELGTKKVAYFEHNDETFLEIAVDELTGNVYYITRGYTVGACNLETEKCANLLLPQKNVPRFRRRNLMLQPKLGRMFWVDDILNSDTVRVASMDGKAIKPDRIESSTVVKALALDRENNFLYMAENSAIYRADLSTSKQVLIFNISTEYLFHYDCKLLFQNSMNKKSALAVYDLNDRTNKTHAEFNSRILAMTVQSPKKPLPNPCSTVNNCKTLCVLSSSSYSPGRFTAKCASEPNTPPAPQEVVKTGSVWSLVFYFVLFVVLAACTYYALKRSEKGRQFLNNPKASFQDFYRNRCC
ncbi:Vitellogenin receptor [Aphelenchoides bicaudatus]|nr:Vitellogenin receptor [Aphelenchoides bicaudatus]